MIDQEIARRMDAYRGNPQALMQRYQQSQQLIDLLALQKLKSEKEAAIRSMQMAAGQQQPTVAQQREQEVLGMTKQEVAQQVGQVAQQRAAKEREAMQRLMQGLASAPGAENVMPPQAMAAGGIVAFQAGGLTNVMGERAQQQMEEKGSIYDPYYGQPRQIREMLRSGFDAGTEDMPPVEALGEDVDETRRRLAEARRRLLTYGARQQKADPEGYAQAKRDVEELSSRERGIGRRYEQQYGGGIYRPPNAPLTTRNFPAAEATAPRSMAPMQDSRAAAEEAAAIQSALQIPTPTAAPQTPPAAPAPAAAPTPEPLMMGPPRPEVPQAGLPAALPQGQDELRAALMGMLKPNVQELIAQRQGMIPGISAERLAARQKAIEERQRAYEQEFDPKQLAMQKLIAFLAAGGGRTSAAGALGAGAQGYAQAAAAQRAAQRERLKELEGLREGVRLLEEARELEQAKAGLGALEAAQAGQRTAVSGLTGLTSAELQAQTSRENARLQAEATRENAQATRDLRAAESEARRLAAQESLASRDLTKYLELSRQRETLAREYFKTMKEDPKNMKVPDATLRAAVDQLLTSFDRDLQVLGQKVGMPSAPRGMNLPSASAIEAELRRREGK